ncbi:DUF6332 family protein [Streptomyces sp. CBMAI 2042]|uniref:DUF6332 family protein n=1 Tax=Streptomyces sp. CBMAI 2042 TaxID=2305222 RepID=UPI003FA72E96
MTVEIGYALVSSAVLAALTFAAASAPALLLFDLGRTARTVVLGLATAAAVLAFVARVVLSCGAFRGGRAAAWTARPQPRAGRAAPAPRTPQRRAGVPRFSLRQGSRADRPSGRAPRPPAGRAARAPRPSG